MAEENKDLQPNQTDDSAIENKSRKAVTKEPKKVDPDQDETAHELPQHKKYSYDDMGRGERFVDVYGHMVKYMQMANGKGIWYLYHAGIWHEEAGDNRIRNLAKDVVKNHLTNEADEFYADGNPKNDDDPKEAKKLFKRFKRDSGATRSISNMLTEAKGALLVDPAEFDSDPMILSTPSGYIDLSDGSMHDPSKSKMLSKATEVTFDKSADCPKWKEFIETTFEGDQELIRYIQKAIGYSLTGSTVEQRMFVLLGDGSNGKSVFNNTILRIMGDYGKVLKASSLAMKQYNTPGGATGDIAQLAGKRFVAANESNKGVRLDEALVKELTGGDRMTARKLYKDDFEFTPQFKIWMSTNSKPVIRGTDHGIWRRMDVIKFNHTVSGNQIDKDLEKKLLAESSGILNWALKGLRMWQQEGLDQPQAVIDAGAEYRSEMDVVAQFIEDMCVLSDKAYVKKSDLYTQFDDWAHQGHEFPLRKSEFNRQMSHKFTETKYNGNRSWKGLRLKDDGGSMQLLSDSRVKNVSKWS